MERMHSFARAESAETNTGGLSKNLTDPTSPTPRASIPGDGELTTFSQIQARDRAKLPNGGCKRDANGHIYPPAGFEVK